MADFKRWMDWLFGILGVALVLGPVAAVLFGCTGENPARREPAAPPTGLLGARWPDLPVGGMGAAGEGPDGSWGEIRPDLGEGEVDAGADGGADLGEAQAADVLPLSAMTCSPWAAGSLRWTWETCADLGEGDACDNRGQWNGEARCVRFGADFCQDDPRTSLDECFACAPCTAR